MAVLPAEHVPHVGHTAVVGQAGEGVEGATARLVEPVVVLPTVDLDIYKSTKYFYYIPVGGLSSSYL